MKTSDFFYVLPEELIAQYPPERRGQSRLLHLNQSSCQISDRTFTEFPDLLKPNDLLVFNNTKVMRARLYGQKKTGGKLEVLIERLIDNHHALAHIRSRRSPIPGNEFYIAYTEISVQGREGNLFQLYCLSGFKELMQKHGHVPLPPYIKRTDTQLDQRRYQTVYAKNEGAVAAPTAGLHFTDKIIKELERRGIGQVKITLHVGAGTFKPVSAEEVSQHKMHYEWLEVKDKVVDQIKATKEQGGRVIAIGTTVVRALETASKSGSILPYIGNTRLFITPGYKFRVVDAMLTNFHLPKSTLLMLVSAFAGHEFVMNSYQHAVKQRYRFFSYGDAMFIET